MPPIFPPEMLSKIQRYRLSHFNMAIRSSDRFMTNIVRPESGLFSSQNDATLKRQFSQKVVKQLVILEMGPHWCPSLFFFYRSARRYPSNLTLANCYDRNYSQLLAENLFCKEHFQRRNIDHILSKYFSFHCV